MENEDEPCENCYPIKCEVHNEMNRYVSLTYILRGWQRNYTEFLKITICTATKVVNKIDNYVSSVKYKFVLMDNKNVDYILNIGHTSMNLRNLVYHHNCNLKEHVKSDTYFSLHMKEYKHNVNWDILKVVHK